MRYYEIINENDSPKMKVDVEKLIPNFSDIKNLASIFKKENKELRIVGGTPRDILLNKKAKDVDLATTANPDEMLQIGKKYNLKTIPTGIEHGTITFLINNEPYEITTLRTDVETDGRHAKVAFTNDWKIDSERRDLSYNSISMDLDGNLYDYHGGIEDLKNGITKFVGDPEKRIQEDFLRILRFFRLRQKIT